MRALDGHDAVLAAALEVLWHGRVTGSDEPLEARGVHDDPKENPGDGAREPENKR